MTDAPMHVAVSGWLLGPPSGANRRLLALLHHAAPLLRAGERITLLHRAGMPAPALPTAITTQAVAVRAGPTLARARDEHRELAATLCAIGATVLDHGFLPLPDVPVPTCLLVHDTRAADGETRWPRPLARWVLRRACRRAAAVVAPSAFTATRLRALTGVEAVVVANGTDTVAVAPPTPGGHLLHIGHLEPRKNLGVLLRAIATIPPSERPRLVLAGGDAGDGPRLHRLATTLGVAADVTFAGAVDDTALAALTAGARAILVPSRYEGFGFAALDGLAHGLPTLVADAGALPEVVGDAGIVLPADDAAAWAAAIRATATATDDAASQRRARAATFAWPNAAAHLVALWRGLSARAS